MNLGETVTFVKFKINSIISNIKLILIILFVLNFLCIILTQRKELKNFMVPQKIPTSIIQELVYLKMPLEFRA